MIREGISSPADNRALEINEDWSTLHFSDDLRAKHEFHCFVFHRFHLPVSGRSRNRGEDKNNYKKLAGGQTPAAWEDNAKAQAGG